MFDDSALEDPHAMMLRGEYITTLALAGARLRSERSEEMSAIVAALQPVPPRSILVMGAEARLIRAIVECSAPVPCVAWQSETLPAWTGPLDLVIVLGGTDSRWVLPCREAIKRGAMVFIVAPQDSDIVADSRSAPRLTTTGDDGFLSALLALKVLDLLNLGLVLDLDEVADTLDEVADRCGPRHGLENNPAKNCACALADAVPLVWGGSSLAARASRRVAEALREATGLPALAADASALLPLIQSAHPRDVFADPFEENLSRLEFSLLVLDDGDCSSQRENLARIAQEHCVRMETITFTHDNPVVRYAGLLHQGLFAAGYLGLATMKE